MLVKLVEAYSKAKSAMSNKRDWGLREVLVNTQYIVNIYEDQEVEEVIKNSNLSESGLDNRNRVTKIVMNTGKSINVVGSLEQVTNKISKTKKNTVLSTKELLVE